MGTSETRQRIVTSAERVFAERGLGPSTVQHVLEAASVSRRTFYQYFQSKEDVLSAVYDARMSAIVGRVAERIRETPDPVEKVTATVDTWLDLQVEGGPLLLALQAEAIRGDSRLHARRERALDGLATAIDAGVRDALGVVADPLVWRGVCLGIEGLVLHLAAQPGAMDRARLRRVSAAMMFAAFANARDLPDPPRPDSGGPDAEG